MTFLIVCLFFKFVDSFSFGINGEKMNVKELLKLQLSGNGKDLNVRFFSELTNLQLSHF